MFIVTVIGHFGKGLISNDGQTIKTKTITKELQKALGIGNVNSIDTHGGLKTLLNAPFIVSNAFHNSSNIIILPAQNGLRIFGPLMAFWKRRNNRVKMHYVVIGGWLTSFIEDHKYLRNSLKRFDGIYVETKHMKNELEKKGFENIVEMPNCKELVIMQKEALVHMTDAPYKVCTFSRVMKEKGIEDAVESVKKVNEHFGKTVYELDIYGQIDANQTEWFNEYRKSFPNYIQYKGVIPYYESTDVIKDYYFLLFPTRFYTEGIPGTIIDALAAGVPSVCSKWENYSDVIDEGVTGIGYEFMNNEELIKVLIYYADHPQEIYDMKRNCIDKAQSFSPQKVIKIITSRL